MQVQSGAGKCSAEGGAWSDVRGGSGVARLGVKGSSDVRSWLVGRKEVVTGAKGPKVQREWSQVHRGHRCKGAIGAKGAVTGA